MKKWKKKYSSFFIFRTESYDPKNLQYPINLKMEISSKIELFFSEVIDAFKQFAINENQCELDKTTNKTIVCFKMNRKSSSLLRISDFWIQLEDNDPISNRKKLIINSC